MTTQTLERPVLAEAADEDIIHLICEYHPNISYCGIDVTNVALVEGEVDECHDCPLCVFVADCNWLCPSCGT